jgi:hypothetical protein
MTLSISDPLALVAIESGLVKAPMADAAAKGSSQLDTQQRSAVIGEPVPVVFCKRTTDSGGVLISPPATEARFENDSSNAVTASYHLVLSEGQIGLIQVRDVFQGPCRVGSFTQTYDRRAGTWTPGNTIADQSQPIRRFFTVDMVTLSTEEDAKQWNLVIATEVTDPAQLSAYPFDLFDTWHEATLTDPDHPDAYGSWDYLIDGDPAGALAMTKTVKAISYSLPACSYYCGSIGTYVDMSTMSYEITTGNGNDRWNRQVHCFIRNGIEVDRLIEEDVDSSNNYADLVNWALLNCAKLPVAMIDTTSLVAAASFLAANDFNCDICIKESGNLADFLANHAPYFLLAETRNNGRRGLRPLLPLNEDHTIKTTAISWQFTFTEDHILPGGLELSYVPLVDRLPFCVQTVWRQQLTDDFGIIRTSEVRYAGEAETGPYEQHDLSAFCTREDHAVKVGAYIRARRKYITHTARISCRAIDFDGLELVPGDIVRVRLLRVPDSDDADDHNYLYEINRITKEPSGQLMYELTHFPIDGDGASLVALDVAAATGGGIMLTSDKSGVSCDLNSSTSTTVPAETYTAGTASDNQVTMTATPEEKPVDITDPPLPAEARNAAIYIHSVEWQGLDLVAKVRVSPTGRAAVEGLGALSATLTNGTTVAVDGSGALLSPQPTGLPSLSLTGTVVEEWSAITEEDKPETPPSDRVFQGEFRVTYSAGDFPPDGAAYSYRMPINITGTSGGFDQVTILNSGVAVFEATPVAPPSSDVLLVTWDSAAPVLNDPMAESVYAVGPGTKTATTITAGEEVAAVGVTGDGNYGAWSYKTNYKTSGQSDFTFETWFAREASSGPSVSSFGIGLHSNDTFSDIYSTFISLAETTLTGFSDPAYPNGTLLAYLDPVEGSVTGDTFTNSVTDPHHLCIMRKDGAFYYYIDGSSVYTSSSSAALAVSFSGDMHVQFSVYASPWTTLCKLGQIRFTPDRARYNSAGFTPDDLPFLSTT